MKKITFLFLFAGIAVLTHAQDKYLTKTGKISFYSRAKSIEKVEADNNEVLSILDTKSGNMVFSVLLKGFHFTSALMEEHFNENYVESSKYPKSTFQGKITSLAGVNFAKDGAYPVTVEGDITLHGVTKKVSAPGSVTIKGGKVAASSKFNLKLKDFNISIPSLVADKISEDIDIVVDCRYEPKS